MEKGIVVTVLAGERVTEIPPRKLSETGSWLCARHSELTELVQQVGAWDTDTGTPNMYVLRDILSAYDLEGRVQEIRRQHSPSRHRAVCELIMMSPGQVGRLRLLATLADRPAYARAPEFSVSDLLMFDHAGKDLIVDYLRAVRVAVCG